MIKPSNKMTLWHSSHVADYWRHTNGIITQRYHNGKHKHHKKVLYLSNDDVGQALIKELRKEGKIRYTLYRCPKSGTYDGNKRGWSSKGHVPKAVGKVIYASLK